MADRTTTVASAAAVPALATAGSVADLIPGDPDQIVSTQQSWGGEALGMRDTVHYATVPTETDWSGHAADAFGEHRTRFLADGDELSQIATHVQDVLDDYATAFQHARRQATTALAAYRRAAAHYAMVTAPGAELASNAAQQRQLAQAAMRRAEHMVATARVHLAAAGDQVRQVIDGETEAVERHAARSRAAIRVEPGHDDSAWPTERVRPEHDGIHDSLWRIARRRLGNGARWPEIYTLNRGHTFPDGHTLNNPSQIRPGWDLRLPVTPAPVGAPAPGPIATILPATPVAPAPVPGPSPAPPGPTHTPAGPISGGHSGVHSAQPTPPVSHPVPVSHTTTAHGGWNLGGGLVLGGAVVAALAAAAAVVRLPRRGIASRVSSGVDSGVEPVVRRLRAALDDRDDSPAEPGRPGDPEPVGLAVGVRGGRELLIDVASSFGLGLAGPGAIEALRAVVIALATSDPPACIVGTPETVGLVLGRHRPPPDGPVQVRETLTAVLDEAEVELITRTRLLEQTGGQGALPPWVILAESGMRQQGRLQAIADNGAGLGVLVLVIGVWPAGLTCHVDHDGRISDAHGPGSEQLVGTQAFTALAGDVRQILDLLATIPAPRLAGMSNSRPPAPPVHHPKPGPQSAEASTRNVAPAVQLGSIADRLNPPATPAIADALRTARASHTDLEIVAPRPGPGSAASSAPQTIQQRLSTTSPKVDQPDRETEPAGRDTTADTVTEVTPIQLTVFGSPSLLWYPQPAASEPKADRPQQRAQDITSVLQPRSVQLLVLLALHPDGITRDTLISTLWGADTPTRPTNALHTALSRLRQAVTEATNGAVPGLVNIHSGRYRLDPAMVVVDYWRFAAAVTARRTAASNGARLTAYHEIVNSYQAPVAEGLHCEWIEPVREAIRRDALDAVAALARALVDSDPQQTLDLLEIARTFDPYNELLYRDIMRLQGKLGQIDAIPRTLHLLTTRLVEIGETPSALARELADHLTQDTATTRSRPR